MKINQDTAFDNKPCWRKNGVWGDEKPRCEKLKVVEHCRNCDVFEQAARAVIVDDVTENHPGNETLTFDDLVQRQRLSGDKSILPFRLGQYCFAIPATHIVTVHDHVPIHSIPFNLNPVVNGVVAVNHEIFTFINIVELLSLSFAEKTDGQAIVRGLYKRILVVDFDSRIMAFYVDEVYPIYRYFHQAVNEELPGDFFQTLSQGRLSKEGTWCDDSHILDLEKIADKFENTLF